MYTVTGSANGAVSFTTGFGIGEGQIEIDEYDTVNKTISGTYKFSAKNVSSTPSGNETLSFQQGVFYKVPVTGVLVL